MKKCIVLLLSVALLFSAFSFCVSAEEIDPLQKFFVYSLHLDGDSRVALADNLKLIKKTSDITPALTAKIASFFSELSEAEIQNVVKIYSQRSAENQYNIQDLILFGAKEMPFIEEMPTIAAEFNRYIIGDEKDNRGVNFFSTLISVYKLYTLFGGDATIASNHELPGLIKLFIAADMPKEVVAKISGSFLFMPTLKEIVGKYEGETLIHQLFAFAEQLVNDCPSNEIYYFKFALDKIGVFEGVAGDPNFNKKYPGITFRDVDHFEWAIPQIQKLVSLGIVNGLGRYVFAPDANVTREQFVKLLTVAFNVQGEPENALPFNDVDSNEWYYPYIKAAYASNIVTGLSADNFGVGDNITREQMATMVYRACLKMQIPLSGSTTDSFEDSNEISGFATEAVSAMFTHKIIKGVGNNRFAPLSLANRAEAVVMIYNVLDYAGLSAND